MAHSSRERNLLDAEQLAVELIRADLVALEESVDCYIPQAHPFMQNFAHHIGTDIYHILGKFHEIIKSADGVLNNIQVSGVRSPAVGRVPKIMHRIWLTDIHSPHEPPEDYIRIIIERAPMYSQGGWKQKIWVQDSKLIPATVSRVLSEGNLIEFHSLEELQGGPWKNTFSAFVGDKKFPFASDILRMKILYEYGGVYADMGANFKNFEVCNFISETFSYSLVFWKNLFFQNSLMMMPPKSIIGEAFLQVVEDPYLVSRDILSPLSAITEGQLFSGLLITALMFSLPMDARDICPLVANDRIVSWQSQQSWYTEVDKGKGRFGNAYIPTAPLSVLDESGWLEGLPCIFAQMRENKV